MNKQTFPNLKQGFLLLLFYFLPPGIFLFLTLTVPQLFGFQLPVLYLTVCSLIAATVGLLPIIIYINKKSGIQFNWAVRLPSISAVFLLALLSFSVQIITSPLNDPKEYFINLFNKKILILFFDLTEFDLDKVMLFIGTVLIAPIFEEILFRKQILGLLLQRNSPVVSIIVSSLLFSLVHLRINDIASLFIWGLLFGIIYYNSKSIELSILFHSFSNLSTYIFGYKYVEITGMQIFNNILFILGGVVVFYLIIRYFSDKNFKRNISVSGSKEV